MTLKKKIKNSGEVSTCVCVWLEVKVGFALCGDAAAGKKHDPDIEHGVTTAGKTRCCFPFYYITAVTSVLIRREFFFISC